MPVKSKEGHHPAVLVMAVTAVLVFCRSTRAAMGPNSVSENANRAHEKSFVGFQVELRRRPTRLGTDSLHLSSKHM